VLYSAAHCGECHAILCNDGGAINNRLCVAPLRSTSHEAWVELLPHSPALYIETCTAFAAGLVLEGRAGGYSQVWLLGAAAVRAAAAAAAGGLGGAPAAASQAPQQQQRLLRVPPYEKIGCISLAGGNMEYGAEGVRLSYSSPTVPRRTLLCPFSALQEGLEAAAAAQPDQEAAHAWGSASSGSNSGVSHFLAPQGALRTLHERPIPNINPSDYAVERLYATAPDGAQIPVSIVYRPSATQRRPCRVLLKGYGSYGLVEKQASKQARVCVCVRACVHSELT